ncbi:EAL domain-containing protein [Pseudomonas sp. NPDC090755]|uniref:EAL domain-containing protein n=1 Tax=Pseudomonas sp. NPDC090755 TaxID=3364481 RepID=UPI00383B2070
MVNFFQAIDEVKVNSISWQKIVDRNNSCIGYEASAPFAGESGQGAEVKRPVLPMISMVRASCIARPRFSYGPPLRMFMKVEKSMLLSHRVVDELIRCTSDLKGCNYQLAIELMDGVVRNMEMATYVEALYRLRESGVCIVLDDDVIEDTIRLELRLDLCDMVKVDVDSFGIFPKSVNDVCVRGYEQVYTGVVDYLQRYGVPLLVGKVESDWQAHVVYSMPFDFFQGYAFGRPKHVLSVRM